MPPWAEICTQEVARSCLTVNFEEGREIICKMGGMTYGISLIFQYIRVETTKVQVSSFTVLQKCTVMDYGIGPTSKV